MVSVQVRKASSTADFYVRARRVWPRSCCLSSATPLPYSSLPDWNLLLLHQHLRLQFR